MFERVETFNQAVIGIENRLPGPMPPEEVGFWVGTIKEELEEFEEAFAKGDFPDQIDAVIDLLYFGAGALTRMGIPSKVSEEIFSAVHAANMSKEKGKKERAIMHDNDAIKPTGWESPNMRIMQILDYHFGR